MEFSENDMLAVLTAQKTEPEAETTETTEAVAETTEAVETTETVETPLKETLAEAETTKIVEAEKPIEQSSLKVEEPIDLKKWTQENFRNLQLLSSDLNSFNIQDTGDVTELLVEGLVEQGYSEREAQILLEEKYPAMFSEDFDENDPLQVRQKEREEIKARTEAKQFLGTLKERQATLERELKLPTSQSNDTVIEKFVEEQNKIATQKVEAAKQGLTRLGSEIAEKYNSLEFEIADGGKVQVELSKEDKDWFKKELVDYQTFFDRNFVNPQTKQVDQERLLKVMMFERLQPTLLKIATGLGNGQGREDLIKNDIKNSSSLNKPAPTPLKPDSIGAQLAQAARDGKFDLNKL